MQERRVTMTVYCGVDLHTRQQLVKWCDARDGEIKEQRLFHDSLADIRNFYSQFSGEVLVGIEACGYSEWFERMLQVLGHEVSRRRRDQDSAPCALAAEDR